MFKATGSGSRYNHSASSTYIPDGSRFEIGYMDGTFIEGYNSRDVVRIGSLVVQNQTLGEAFNQSRIHLLLY